MKSFAWVVPVFIGAALILSGCREAGNGSGEVPLPERRTDAAGKMTDADLEMAIKSKLESEQALKEAKLAVKADADENKAIISGTVPSEEVRSKAIELARAVQPGLMVDDQIQVKPAG